jgi:hypothetical protein
MFVVIFYTLRGSFLKAILTKKSELHFVTIYLGQRRRSDGLARPQEGSGEECGRVLKMN